MEYNKKYVLRNGKNLIVRLAQKEDAEDLTVVSNLIHSETNFCGFSTKEKSFSVSDSVSHVEKMNSAKRSVLLVAEYDGKVVGTSQITPKSIYKWKKHIAEFGIAIIKRCWGLGIAGKLMASIIECAKKFKYEQIELSVVAENVNALNLYKSFGFEVVGVVKNAYKFSKTHYSDRIIMTKILTNAML